MFADLLKEIYFKERRKLEGTRICQQESKMRLLRLLREVIDHVQETLTLGEIEGRSDIHESVKDLLLRVQDNANQVEERLETIIAEEQAVLEKAEEAEVKNINYSPSEYADYLYQLEKVYALETALTEERLFPEVVYAEMSERERTKSGEKPE